MHLKLVFTEVGLFLLLIWAAVSKSVIAGYNNFTGEQCTWLLTPSSGEFGGLGPTYYNTVLPNPFVHVWEETERFTDDDASGRLTLKKQQNNSLKQSLSCRWKVVLSNYIQFNSDWFMSQLLINPAKKSNWGDMKKNNSTNLYSFSLSMEYMGPNY